GTLAITGGGTGLTYTPAANYNGPDSFFHTITDKGTTAGAADYTSAPPTVTITVSEANDAPTATADAATVAEDSSANVIDVLTNEIGRASCREREKLTVRATTDKAKGRKALTGGGTGTPYTTAAKYSGQTHI